jgi:hypothetical protein
VNLSPIVVCVSAILATACAASRPPRSDSQFVVRVDGAPAVELRVEVSADRLGQTPRWIEGARVAVAHHLRILGRAPASTITLVDRWSHPGGAADAGTIPVSLPFLTTNRSHVIEGSIARAVARAFWHVAIPCDDAGGSFIEGLAAYTATVALVSQYGDLREPPGIGQIEQRWFSGLVPWVIPIDAPAWSAASWRDDGATASRGTLAMRTLANWIGTPNFDAALRALAAESRRGCASWRELQARTSEVTGLDLSWFFAPVFASGRRFDYGVESIVSELQPAAQAGAPHYRTRVVLRRYGDALFTGTSAQPISPFSAGRGVELSVRFADGAEQVDYWDGRADRQTFEYDSPSRAVAAVVDPRRVIALDANRTNNSRTVASRTNLATRWSTQWMLWLEHALLSYASLV